jgi:hypothetical protein
MIPQEVDERIKELIEGATCSECGLPVVIHYDHDDLHVEPCHCLHTGRIVRKITEDDIFDEDPEFQKLCDMVEKSCNKINQLTNEAGWLAGGLYQKVTGRRPI